MADNGPQSPTNIQDDPNASIASDLKEPLTEDEEIKIDQVLSK